MAGYCSAQLFLVILVFISNSPGFNAVRNFADFPTSNEIYITTNDKVNAGILADYEVDSSCSVQVQSPNDCHYTFTPQPSDCLNPNIFFEQLFGVSNAAIYLINQNLPPNNYFTGGTMDVCTKNATYTVKNIDTVSMAANFLSLDAGSIAAVLHSHKNKTFNLTVDGVIGFAGQKYDVTGNRSANLTHGGWDIKGTLQSSVATVSQLLGDNNFVSSSAINTALNALNLGDVSLSNVMFQGKFNYTIRAVRLSFDVVFPAMNNPTFIISFTKKKNGSNWDTIFHIASQAEQVTLSSTLQALAGLDISSVPLLSSISVTKFRVVYSTAAINGTAIPYPTIDLKKLLPLKKGITLAFMFDAAAETHNVTIRMQNIKSIIFQFKSTNGLKLIDFLGPLKNKIESMSFPAGLNPAAILNWKIKGVLLNGSNKTAIISVGAPGAWTVIPGALVLENLTLKLTVVVDAGKTNLTLGMNTTWTVGKLSFTLAISRNFATQTFIAEARPQLEIPFGSLIQKFAVALVPAPLEKYIKDAGLTGFSIIEPYIKMHLGNTKGVNLKGRTVIGDWKNSRVEVIMGEYSGSKLMAAGLMLGKTPITDVIKTITGLNAAKVPGISLLDNTQIAIVMSSQYVPQAAKDLQFTDKVLKNMQIADGVELVGLFQYPDPCDELCTITKKILGKDTKFIVKGKVQATSMKLSVTLPTTIKVIDGASITGVGFELEVGTLRNAIAVKGSLVLSQPPLTFNGAFGLSTSGVYLEMSTIGTWRKPFGIQFMEVSNMNFRVAITPDPLLISAIEFGGSVRLGKIDDPSVKCIEATGYVGIDRINPANSYVFYKINVLTLDAILQAFGAKVTLPKPIAEMGFPDGVYVSFATETKSLPTGTVIPRGFFLKGTLKIMFFKVSADISLDLNGILADMKVSPFKLGSNLVSVSGKNTNSGPRLLVDLRWNPPRAQIIIEGRLTVLGITQAVNLSIDTSGFHFKIEGKILNLFEAYLEISAAYANPAKASFQVKGEFQSQLMKTLEDNVKKALDNYKKKANEEIGKAQAKVNTAKGKFQDANKEIEKTKHSVNKAKAEFKKADDALNSAKDWLKAKNRDFDKAVNTINSKKDDVNKAKRKFDDAVNSLNKKGSCPGSCRKRRSLDAFVNSKQAKGFLGEDRRKRGWGWNPSKWVKEKAREVKCKAQWVVQQACLKILKGLQWAVSNTKGVLNVANAALSVASKAVDKSRVTLKGAELGVTAAQKIVDKSKGVLNVANAALTAAQGVVTAASKSVDLANAALSAAKTVNSFGTDIAQKVVSLGLGGLIDIQKLEFNIKLSVVKSGKFSGSITVSFLRGNPKKFGFLIQLKSIGSMVNSLVKEVRSEIGVRKRSISDVHFPAIVAMSDMEPDMDEMETRSVNDTCATWVDIKGMVDMMLDITLPLQGHIQNIKDEMKRQQQEHGLKEEDIPTRNLMLETIDALNEAMKDGVEAVIDLMMTETGLEDDAFDDLLVEIAETAEAECIKDTVTTVKKLTDRLPENQTLGKVLLGLKETTKNCTATAC